MRKFLEILCAGVVLLPFAGLLLSRMAGFPAAHAAGAEEPAAKKRPVAVFDTNKGSFRVELYTDLAPNTAQNFIDLFTNMNSTWVPVSRYLFNTIIISAAATFGR